ncbi:MAG: hypothetical protein AB8C95_13595 [Phycisphaeraceae bacterium]
MLELFHAVITSLLLSAAMGGSVDKSAEAEDEPANSETGVDVGMMPSYLVSPRGLTKAEQDEDDDYQPTALPGHAVFCEPAVLADQPFDSVNRLPLAAAFSTAGRSP